MFKVPEVAKQLNCSISTVYGLVDTGKLVAYRIGLGRGALRITESDLTTFLESCRTQKTEGVRKLPRSRLRHIRL
jgi:excisionase family DNA binding protein